MSLDPKVMARLDAKVDRSGGPSACWPWLGHIDKRKGTPNMFYSKDRVTGVQQGGSPRRLVWERAFGYRPARNRIIKFSCGNLLCMNPSHMIMPTVEAKFWARVEKTPTCWLFMGARNRRGYGQFFPVQGDHRAAHRYAFEVTHGSIPDDMLVCHRCDNPPCVNPAHLFLGTNADNIHDMIAKGRNSRGEKHAIAMRQAKARRRSERTPSDAKEGT